MDSLELALIILAAVIAIGIVVRTSARKREVESASVPPMPAPTQTTRPASGPSGADLAAIIAAAIAAESGIAPDSFCITGISAVGGQGSLGGFNTPPWGYADRLSRSARI